MSVTFKYDADGGSAIPDTVTPDGTITASAISRKLSAAATGKTGYTNTHWNLYQYSLNGSISYPNTNHIPSSQFVFNTISTNIRIYWFIAVWAANTYTVTYKKNDGSTDPDVSNSVSYPDSFVYKNATAFSRTGNEIIRWATNPDGSGTSYTLGQIISGWTKEPPITVYAIWKNPFYTLTYNGNGISTNSSTQSEGGSSVILPELSALGYVFVQWSLYSSNVSSYNPPTNQCIKPYIQYLNPDVNPGIIASTTGITISFWYNLISKVNGAKLFLYKCPTTEQRFYVSIDLVYGSYVLNYQIYPGASDNGRYWQYVQFNTVQLNTWNHIVWSIEKTGEWTIYQNNIKENLWSGYGVNYTLGVNPSWNGSMTEYYIGGGGFDGYIDAYSVYNKVLTSDEVNIIYKTKSFLADNIVAFYGFDGNTDDNSGNNYHIGSLNQGSTFSINQNMQIVQSTYNANTAFTMPSNNITLYAIWADGYVLTYDGNGKSDNSSIVVAKGSINVLPNLNAIRYRHIQWNLYTENVSTYSPYVNGSIKAMSQNLHPDIKPGVLAVTSGLSISFWYKINNYVLNSKIFYIDNGGNGSPNATIYIQMRLNGISKVLEFIINNTAFSVSPGSFVSNINAANTYWNHIVWSINPDGVWSIYFNNTKLNVNITYKLAIMASQWNNYNMGIYQLGYDNYDGYIDGFSIYNKVLSTSEINAIYTSKSFLTNNVVAFYGFDDNSQTSWQDSSGNGFHLTTKSSSTVFSDTEYVKVIPYATYNIMTTFKMLSNYTTLYAIWEDIPVRLTDIKKKFNSSGTGPISLKAYYNNAGLISGVSGIPSSGAISIKAFKEK